MKITTLIFLILMLLSCGSGSHPTWIQDIEKEGYTYIEEVAPPNGISDTMMYGYTDRENGIFHPTSLAFRTLKISGYKFEKSPSETYKQPLMIYRFEFKDATERKAFEDFQKYILNYQRHVKNTVEFYENEGEWILKFGPMP